MPQPLRIGLLIFVGATVLGFVVYAFIRGFRRAEDPTRLAVKWVLTLVLLGGYAWFAKDAVKTQFGAFAVPLGAVVIAVILTPLWAPHIGHLVASPFTSLFDGGNEEIEPQPLYSVAESLRRRGKFREAIYAIQEQLQKFPSDFTGQIMLAEIQAENLNELAAAEITIHRICEQQHPPANIAYALNSLADWHRRYDQDTDAAKNALQKIVELLPNTEFERSAAQRIAHLADPDILLKLREPEAIVMKHGVEYLGLLKDQSHLLPKEKLAEEQASELVAHLEAHPLDREARERLAVIYAREFGRLDLATAQLEQLIAVPDESPRHVARWLNLLADLQVHVTNSTELAEQTLRRIIELYPAHSAAQIAENRLAILKLELKRYQEGHTVKFPSSEARRT
jgi:tetratricopeptide (TPR) repeat protein